MANKVKLVNAQAAGVVGTGYRFDMARPPYTLRCSGGYTTGVGQAGTNGIKIESSNDSTTGLDGTWIQEVGVVGGANYTEQSTSAQDCVDLPDQTIVKIDHHCKWLRASTGANLGGTATVTAETDR